MPPTLLKWRTPLLGGSLKMGCALHTKCIRALRHQRSQANDAESLKAIERVLECPANGHNPG